MLVYFHRNLWYDVIIEKIAQRPSTKGPTMTPSVAKQIKQAVADANIKTYAVQLPITYADKVDDAGRPVFVFANGVELPFLEIGAGYLHERLKGVPYATFTKLYRDEKFADLAAHTAQRNDSLVAATYEGAVVGLMSNYVPVSHTDLVTDIAEAKLDQHIVRWNLTQTGLRMDLALRSEIKEKSGQLLAALTIDNGHSGHYALRYRATIRVDDFEWQLPLSQRRRHLSNVHLAQQALVEALKTVEDLRIEDKLKAMTIDQVKAIVAAKVDMTVRQERLFLSVMDTKPANASEFVATAGIYASTVGYSSAVHKMLNPILDAVIA